MKMTFREAREKAGLSRRELAEKAGISQKTIEAIEAGNDPRLSTALKLATVLGIKLGIKIEDMSDAETITVEERESIAEYVFELDMAIIQLESTSRMTGGLSGTLLEALKQESKYLTSVEEHESYTAACEYVIKKAVYYGKEIQKKERYRGFNVRAEYEYKRDGFFPYILEFASFPDGTDDDPAPEANKVFATQKEALEDAKRQVDEYLLAKEKRNAHYLYTTEDEEEAKEKNLAEYHCWECGNIFFAHWRWKHSPSPPCPRCGTEVDEFIKIVRG
jgi:DNA-binding XRE family transcriptional regulator/DNA-directed RNA polymerase subunit RPC12/RpoP